MSVLNALKRLQHVYLPKAEDPQRTIDQEPKVVVTKQVDCGNAAWSAYTELEDSLAGNYTIDAVIFDIQS